MSTERPAADMRVLLLAPTARDGAASHALLDSAGIRCTLCADLDSVCGQAAGGVAAVIVPEEIVLADASNRLPGFLRAQPVWSDLPVIVLSRTGAQSPAVDKALATLGNVNLVERPVRVSTLLSVVRTALRARERQYQMRDYLAQRARTEEDLRAANATAEAAGRAKDRFLAVLSHELRTPLSPVVMTIAALVDDPSLPLAARQDLAMVRRNIDLETKLIDDLLDLSRVTTGKLRLQLQPARLHEVLGFALESCESDLSTKNLLVELRLQAEDDRVHADPARLQQVFWNLLKNAAKFTPENGHITVHTCNPTDGRIEVAVTDNGIGIAPEILPKIFDAFEQGDARNTQQFGGLGLGLAISKAIVDIHGGAIRAHSAGKAHGATFTVGLPLSARVPTTRAPAQPSRNGNGHGVRPRLLLVEDHADTARVLAMLLKRSGYPVQLAHNVADALELAAAESFDLLVSDIGLPDASGYDLMSQLRDRYQMRGIALSGYGMEEDMRRSHEAGFADHVVKPVNFADLEAVIQKLTNGKNA
ncbi:MAG TPA: ATP-binding protein [Tepidisphaeraceae bacterium]|jgi:signal transduction histidine kinase|nr:ATP-binding protein [Tepidisphaeraceae bacterium]